MTLWPPGVSTTRQRCCVGITAAVVVTCLGCTLWAMAPRAVIFVAGMITGAALLYALFAWSLVAMDRKRRWSR